VGQINRQHFAFLSAIKIGLIQQLSLEFLLVDNLIPELLT